MKGWENSSSIERLKARGMVVGTNLLIKIPQVKKYKWIIGIDPGVNTGYAIWDRELKKFIEIGANSILKTMDLLKHVSWNSSLFRVEDARKRTWIPKMPTEKRERGRNQGAGSIMRDCKIWEDFLTDLGVDFEMVAPKNNKTKLDAKKFIQVTGWSKQTNSHSRDAAMLVYNS